MSSHADAISQNKSLEEISDENLIRYFKTELENIEGGIKASEILPKGVLKRFHKLGVFKILTPHSCELSDMVRDILQNPRR